MSRARFGLSFAGREEVLAHLHDESTIGLTLDASASVRPERARHVFVEGENLEVLRRLERAYRQSVQLVYLDPPYNTGHDFVYRDRFASTRVEHLQRTGQVDELGEPWVPNPSSAGRYHSNWLSMMYPRLWAARALLRDDGLLMCSIDDHEIHHLRLVLDEIFGEDCFIAQIVVVTNRGGRDYLRIATGHEYLVVYGASPDAPVRALPRERPVQGALRDQDGEYELRELRNRNPKFHPQNRPNLFYPIYVIPEAGADALCPVRLEPGPGRVAVEPRNARGGGSVWRWSRDTLAAGLSAANPVVVARRRRDGQFNVYEKVRHTSRRPRALWDEPEMRSECGTADLRRALGADLFDHPKPVALLRRCLQMATDPDGLVLDFFAGSGTTQQAVLEQNAADGGTRRCLSIQWPEPTPPDSTAHRHGYATVSAIARARVTAVMGEAAGVRWFRAEPDPRPRWEALRTEDPAAYLAALDRHAEARTRAALQPWTLALEHGFPLDGGLRVTTQWWVLERDDGRALAIELQPGSDPAPVGDEATVLVPDARVSTWDPVAAERGWRLHGYEGCLRMTR